LSYCWRLWLWQSSYLHSSAQLENLLDCDYRLFTMERCCWKQL
jgi:hypothetical protein